ncbi:hypothetical protein [Yoonia sp. R78084]|uniref:hypothetical protein n=1 Tax=Yoonia sp. R78084 TaxID=3093869 RepID=UPI0037DC9AE0
MVARSVQPWRGSPASGTANKVRAITSAVTSAIAVAVAIAIAIAIAIPRAGIVAATIIAIAGVVATAIIAVAVAFAVVTVAVTVVAVTAIAVVAVAIIAVAAAASVAVAAAASIAVAAAASVAAVITASGVAIAATVAGAPAATTHSRRLCIPQSRDNIHRKLSGPVPDSLRRTDPENSGDRRDDHKIDSGRAILILPEFLENCASTGRSLGLGVLRQKNFVPEYIKHCIIPSKHARDTQTARHTAFQFVR